MNTPKPFTIQDLMNNLTKKFPKAQFKFAIDNRIK